MSFASKLCQLLRVPRYGRWLCLPTGFVVAAIAASWPSLVVMNTATGAQPTEEAEDVVPEVDVTPPRDVTEDRSNPAGVTFERAREALRRLSGRESDRRDDDSDDENFDDDKRRGGVVVEVEVTININSGNIGAGPWLPGPDRRDGDRRDPRGVDTQRDRDRERDSGDGPERQIRELQAQIQRLQAQLDDVRRRPSGNRDEVWQRIEELRRKALSTDAMRQPLEGTRRSRRESPEAEGARERFSPEAERELDQPEHDTPDQEGRSRSRSRPEAVSAEPPSAAVLEFPSLQFVFEEIAARWLGGND